MKKILGIVVLGLLFGGSAYSKVIEINKCLKNKYPYETNWYDLSDDIEDIIFSSNFSFKGSMFI